MRSLHLLRCPLFPCQLLLASRLRLSRLLLQTLLSTAPAPPLSLITTWTTSTVAFPVMATLSGTAATVATDQWGHGTQLALAVVISVVTSALWKVSKTVIWLSTQPSLRYISDLLTAPISWRIGTETLSPTHGAVVNHPLWTRRSTSAAVLLEVFCTYSCPVSLSLRYPFFHECPPFPFCVVLFSQCFLVLSLGGTLLVSADCFHSCISANGLGAAQLF